LFVVVHNVDEAPTLNVWAVPLLIVTIADVAFGETNFGLLANVVVADVVVEGVANVKLNDPLCVGPPLPDDAGTVVAA